MKVATIAKLTAALALASTTLFAGTGRADDGFHGYRAGPGPAQVVHHDGHYRGPAHEGQYRPAAGGDRAIEARQAQQRERIREGVRSGRLTASEARELGREQRRIEGLERSFLADGHLSPAELQVLDRQLDQANRNLYAENHDRQRRY